MVDRVGILGVGRMGLPIAQAWTAAGVDVLAWDPDGARLTGLVAASSPGALASSVDVLVTILPGVPEVEAAVSDLSVTPSLWLDLTSSDPRVTERLAAGPTVGAPMGGGVAAAASRSLRFFVGGAVDHVARVRPLLELVGTVDHIGPAVGDGYTAKLIANLLWFGQAVAVTEALLLGQSLAIPPARLRDILATSAGGSVFIDEYLDRLLDGDYLESFGIDRVVEELDILASLASQQGVPFELSATVGRLHREALERFGAVPGELLAARLLEERASQKLRR